MVWFGCLFVCFILFCFVLCGGVVERELSLNIKLKIKPLKNLKILHAISLETKKTKFRSLFYSMSRAEGADNDATD